jgi:hypothetical protein
MNPRQAATALAVARLAIGAGLAAAPGLATRGWIGPHAENAGARLMARAAGGRDVGLAAGILATLSEGRRRRHRRATKHWLEAAALADAVDLVATLAARRSLPPASLAVGTSMAGASALAHLWLTREMAE